MLRRLTLGIFAAAALLFALAWQRGAQATIHYGWAGEFVSARTACVSYFTLDCPLDHLWDGNYVGGTRWPNQRWSPVGFQGASARATAKEKFVVEMVDVLSNNCFNNTITLTRWRVTPVPAIGSSCTTVPGQTYVGASSYTYSSCSGGMGDYSHWHRLIPAMDFTSETAVNTKVGYHSRMTAVNNQSSETVWTDGCFEIWWGS